MAGVKKQAEMSLVVSVFEQLRHTNINLRYFIISCFYQNDAGRGFFAALKHQRSRLPRIGTQKGYALYGHGTPRFRDTF